jgi:copper chaperone CopZ
MTKSIATALMLLAAATFAGETITVTGAHNCCGSCKKGIVKAIKSAGASGEVTKKEIKITATDAEQGAKALQALAKAGFHGETDHATLKMPDDSGVPAGDEKVESLKLDVGHNCCKGCSKALIKATEAVDGIDSHDIEKKKTIITVKGNFVAHALIEAMKKVGYHVSVAK